MQVDQGVGIGIKSPFFNRFQITGTKFIPLKKVEEYSRGGAPPVLVVHGLYGGCIGDLPNHEAFTIGGPHSVRGYDVGEIGASRYKLEVPKSLSPLFLSLDPNLGLYICRWQQRFV